MTIPSMQTTSSTTASPWEPVRLSEAHRYMIEQSVRGVPLRRIQTNLKRFGQHYSGGHIKKVVASHLGQEYASLVSAQVHGGIPGLVEQGAAHLPEAVHVQLAIMRDPLAGERHRLAAAESHLDRFGLPKISRQQLENDRPQVIVINLTPEQHASFLQPPMEIEAETVQLPPAPREPDEEPGGPFQFLDRS
jgi:hypothetical protein